MPGKGQVSKNRCKKPGHAYIQRGGRWECHQCDNERSRRYMKEKTQRLKRQAMDAYGGVCACCGEAHLVFLCIDHVGGGGNKWRSQHVKGSLPTYRWLIEHDFPEGFQVLCHNCNMATALGDVCPHQL